MFRFDREQMVIEIAGRKFGGQPGEYPTGLSGTIFYARHKIVEDERKGIFDKSAAEDLINKQAEMHWKPCPCPGIWRKPRGTGEVYRLCCRGMGWSNVVGLHIWRGENGSCKKGYRGRICRSVYL